MELWDTSVLAAHTTRDISPLCRPENETLFVHLNGGVRREDAFDVVRRVYTVACKRDGLDILCFTAFKTVYVPSFLGLVKEAGTDMQEALCSIHSVMMKEPRFGGRFAFFGIRDIMVHLTYPLCRFMTELSIAHCEMPLAVDLTGDESLQRIHLHSVSLLKLIKLSRRIVSLIVDDCNMLEQIVAPPGFEGEATIYRCRELRSLVYIPIFMIADCNQLYDVTSFDHTRCRIGPDCNSFPIQLIQMKPQFLSWVKKTDQILSVSPAISAAFSSFYALLQRRLRYRIHIPKIDATINLTNFVFLGEDAPFLLFLKSQDEWESNRRRVLGNDIVFEECMKHVVPPLDAGIDSSARFNIYRNLAKVVIHNVESVILDDSAISRLIADATTLKSGVDISEVLVYLCNESPSFYVATPILIFVGDIVFTSELQHAIVLYAAMAQTSGHLDLRIEQNNAVTTLQMGYEHVYIVSVSTCPNLQFLQAGCFVRLLHVEHCASLICIKTHPSHQLKLNVRDCLRLQCVAGGVLRAGFFNCQSIYSVSHNEDIDIFPGCPLLPLPDRLNDSNLPLEVFSLPLLADATLAALDDTDARKIPWLQQRAIFEERSIGTVRIYDKVEQPRTVVYPQALGSYTFIGMPPTICFVGSAEHAVHFLSRTVRRGIDVASTPLEISSFQQTLQAEDQTRPLTAQVLPAEIWHMIADYVVVRDEQVRRIEM